MHSLALRIPGRGPAVMSALHQGPLVTMAARHLGLQPCFDSKPIFDRKLLDLVTFVSALTLAVNYILTRITALKYMRNIFLQCVHFSVVDHIELKDIRFHGRRYLRFLRLFIWVPSYLINRRRDRDRIRHSIFLYNFEYLVAVERASPLSAFLYDGALLK